MATNNASRARLSVRAKLMGLTVGASLLALVTACAAFVFYDRSSYSEAKQRTLSVLVSSVAQSAFGPTAFQDPDSANVILRVLDAEPTARGGAIYAADGTRIAAWTRKGSAHVLPERWADGKAAKSGYVGRELVLNKAIESPEQKVGTLHVVFDTHDIDARTKRFLEIALLVLAVSAVAAFVLAWLAQSVLTRPVRILAEAAHRVEADKDFNIRAERVSNDELGQLTDAFNSMLATIQSRDEELARHQAGLEDQVKERTRDLDARNREMRLVLDNVDQGLVILSPTAEMTGERSAALDRWFGEPHDTLHLGAHLARVAPSIAEPFAIGWNQLAEGILPIELNLAQMPQSIETESGRFYNLAYRPIGGDGESTFNKMLLIVSDVTEHVERERSEAAQAETLALFEQISLDRSGFQDFYDETQATIARLLDPKPRDVTLVLRELHTLKGNFGLFGLRSMGALMHTLEDECLPEQRPLDEAQRQRLREAFAALEKRIKTFLGDGPRPITVERSELDELERAIAKRTDHEVLARLVERLGFEPVAPKLSRLGDRALGLATRLGKTPLDVRIEGARVKASPETSWLWNVLPHVVANAVDHGVLTPGEREAAGKPASSTLKLSATVERDALVVEISDDGRGIDWDALRAKALRLGLPANSNADAEAALFADGVSTREAASDVSGRGIGMAAVKAACAEHGASLRVRSTPGRGTTFRIELSSRASTSTVASRARLSLSA